MKKSFFTLILSLFLIFLTLEANAQGSITVRLKMPPPGKLNVTDFYAVTLVNNTESAQSVYLVGTATEEKDGLIARGTTVPFNLKKGTTMLKIKDLSKTPDVEYTAKDPRYKTALVRTGDFPSGVYEVCVSVFSDSTNAELGSDCFSQTVSETGILSLINPSDGQEIVPKTPLIFTWMYSGKPSSEGYTLKIVEVKKGQTPESAMERNRAFFEKKGIRSTTLKYPNSAPTFEEGKKYAWHIKSGATLSEIFTFRISDQNGPVIVDSSQTEIIDFEDLTGLVEGDIIFDQYYNNGAPCGVRFYLGDTVNNIHPVLARVGDPITAFSHDDETPNPNLTDPSCGQTFPTQSDMPEPGEGVGCWFLTDDGIVADVPFPLNVVYNSPTTQASGFLLDIDADEQWTIRAYADNGSLVGEIFLCHTWVGAGISTLSDCFNWDASFNSISNDGDGIATYWEFNAVNTSNTPFTRIEFSFSGTTAPNTAVGLAFDNFSPCSIQNNTGSVYCCDGDNLIINGNFEDGANGFTSDYTSTTGIPFPGEYSVIDFNDASSICSEWNVEDHSHCENATGGNNKILAVNGETMQTSTANNVIWRGQPLPLEVDSLYKFCAYLKHLPQCCFDIVPKYSVQIYQEAPGSVWTNLIPWTTFVYSGTNSPPCDWELISGTFTAISENVAIRILLDEQGIGDGNDLAIDDISLQKTQQTPKQYTMCDITPSNVTSTGFNVTATQPNLPSGHSFDWPNGDCGYAWSVCELDNNYNCIAGTAVFNPSGWWTYPSTTFPGYDGTSTLSGSAPGIFDINKRYRISYGVWCDCLSWNSSSWIWDPGTGKKSAPIFIEDKDYKLPPETIKEIMKRN